MHSEHFSSRSLIHTRSCNGCVQHRSKWDNYPTTIATLVPSIVALRLKILGTFVGPESSMTV